jgi:hypothetical protein
MSITNIIQSAASTAAKYANPANIIASASSAISGLGGLLSGGGLSSMPPIISPANPTINGSQDIRARLRVPESYLVGYAQGPNNELVNAGGIIFPYTPNIQVEHKATYTEVNAIHSNYTQYFYKNSAVGEITLSAKFTVQNETEAGIFIATVHLLRALTKMRFGNDTNAGSPPPICRLMAYGDFMLDNTPVTISGFRQEFPVDVDYFNTGITVSNYGITAVPVLCTLQLTLLPIYSRNEMLGATVDDFLSGDQRTRGFL